MNAQLQTPTEIAARRSAAELIAQRVHALLSAADAKATDALADGSTRGNAQRLAGAEGRAWQRLLQLFALSPAEADLLQFAIGAAVDPSLGALLAQVQQMDARWLPTEQTVIRLCGHPSRPIWRPTSPLSMWGLLTPIRRMPGEAPGFEADPRIVDWLFGSLSLDAALVLAAERAPTRPVAPEWPVRAIAERVEHALRQGAEVRVVIEARSGAGRSSFACAVAAALGREALLIDPSALIGNDWPDAYMRAQRFALYADVALIWREGAPAWPHKLPMAPLQFVCVGESEAPPAHAGCADIVVALPEPGVAAKAAILSQLAPQLADAALRIAATPGLSLADLEEAAASAPRSAAEAAAHLRARARARMHGVGRVVDPQFDWDDLVLAPDLAAQLRRIAFEVRTRPSLLACAETARLFEGAAGLSALFSGPPGVGKSMAAQVIARELGINLLVIDIASTTSKFIGETAKNLSNAFARARAAGAALIFEEADALFARRTEVKDSNDRHANADTNHLLQLMEGHDGLVILSTNRRANIDPAFIRRLRHVLEFPRPGPEQRLRLWQTMLGALGAELAPLQPCLQALATSHELSPAQIKSAALSAAYSARERSNSVDTDDLLQAAALELTKEGRSAPPQARATRHRGSGAHG
ncbi:ATP-binding protein [Aquimonas sp.]|jgi:hypothetical protein|uniref:ATP-binding protein n=1 Tax=Aquimonas sp. TaxID=1872588 RepID=UPI0037C0B59E